MIISAVIFDGKSKILVQVGVLKVINKQCVTSLLSILTFCVSTVMHDSWIVWENKNIFWLINRNLTKLLVERG